MEVFSKREKNWLNQQIKSCRRNLRFQKIVSNMLAEFEMNKELESLTNEELVLKAIKDYTDYTWHPVVEEMMNRLYPEWEDVDLNE